MDSESEAWKMDSESEAWKMDSESKKTIWEEALFETRYPSWILMLILTGYAIALLIVLIT
ncbi:MAG: hypothetical protein KKI12_11025 [Proteobacteria bacterium]|nr:hypothetical protein [Pseudomonadota bacterium]MBU4258947.1 hypothetical protein [Pseudomonadota bacterium]MBU4288689.1 hypothetical protein [Pseudomonadota bacterium]MBU4414359.1 hypothetical protein [Pseudomonadota bacterium]